MGCRVLLLTININNVAFMPCNPSIGGPGKGNLVREIDALGGAMGRVADLSHIQIRELNTQKGPAVRALRAQSDKRRYQEIMLHLLEQNPLIHLRQAEATEIMPKGSSWMIKTSSSLEFIGKTIVIATGTFLRGHVHIGEISFPSGPQGQHPAIHLAESMEKLGILFKRYKTGTPARIRMRSLNYQKMTEQPGDELYHGFSFWIPWHLNHAKSCWLTYTNEKTHEIIYKNLHRAAMFSGAITGVGPRYCPSIESKLTRFPDRERHQVFIEPEGTNTDEGYVAGLSTSLPEDVQEEFLRTIPGMENVEIVRPGYAIEYDALPAELLSSTLEIKKLPGIYSAGQLNGSSGYEEAAAQGLMAGINAACRVLNEEPLVLKRNEAYIGVLIDDLVTKSSEEPYRIMTSRAEFRISLRHENADIRLAKYGLAYGLLNEDEKYIFQKRNDAIEAELKRLQKTKVQASTIIEREHTEKISLAEILRRPEIDYQQVIQSYPSETDLSQDVIDSVVNIIKYQGYIERENEIAQRIAHTETKRIPDDINYFEVDNLSSEAREKLIKFKPDTLGQAGRISGISPADICSLLFYLHRKGRGKDDQSVSNNL
jgi:tRNA uridine 5-carboxymethylaminomethyl modification enzyme